MSSKKKENNHMMIQGGKEKTIEQLDKQMRDEKLRAESQINIISWGFTLSLSLSVDEDDFVLFFLRRSFSSEETFSGPFCLEIDQIWEFLV